MIKNIIFFLLAFLVLVNRVTDHYAVAKTVIHQKLYKFNFFHNVKDLTTLQMYGLSLTYANNLIKKSRKNENIFKW